MESLGRERGSGVRIRIQKLVRGRSSARGWQGGGSRRVTVETGMPVMSGDGRRRPIAVPTTQTQATVQYALPSGCLSRSDRRAAEIVARTGMRQPLQSCEVSRVHT
jgi:hypothetical protein